MMGFVDLHCHILPKVDDGPKTPGESVEMLRIAKSEGFTDIVATPHYAPQIPGFQGVCDAMQSASLFSDLSIAALELGITLHKGSEIRLEEQAHSHLMAGKCLPIGHGRHVLLELPDNAVLEHLFCWMTAFTSDGWIPVLAHVERLQALQADPYALEDWVEAGCLLQVNASSIRMDIRSRFDRWTDPRRKTAKRLLKKGLCHVVATDAHSPFNRAPVVREAYKAAAKWLGEEAARDLFCFTPRRILGLPELSETAYDRV